MLYFHHWGFAIQHAGFVRCRPRCTTRTTHNLTQTITQKFMLRQTLPEKGLLMQFVRKIFPIGQFVICLIFIVCAAALIIFAVLQLWQGIQLGTDQSLNERLNAILECIAMLTVAVAALELGQTLLEEEVQRDTHISGPTRVRRFLSRFMVVLVVALAIETLVLAFRLSHEAPEQLPFVAGIGISAAALLVAWGAFVRLNRSAEELEPEGMEQAKREDEKVQK